jgi:hypothetical protein
VLELLELLLPGGPSGGLSQVPLRVSFWRPVTLQLAPAVLPLQAATASAGGPPRGGAPPPSVGCAWAALAQARLSARESQMGMGFKMRVLRVEVLMLRGACRALLACWWLGGKARSAEKAGPWGWIRPLSGLRFGYHMNQLN